MFFFLVRLWYDLHTVAFRIAELVPGVESDHVSNRNGELLMNFTLQGDSTDNAIEETNSVDNGMYKDDGAYVHEAFLADWRPDSNASLSCFPHLSAQGGYQACEQRVFAGSRNFQTQLCSNAPSSSK